MKPLLLGLTAFGIGAILLGAAVGGLAFQIGTAISAALFITAGIAALSSKIGSIRKYDLKQLEKVDREERRRLIEQELEQLDSAGNAICLTCGNHFDPELMICPRCGRSIYG